MHLGPQSQNSRSKTTRRTALPPHHSMIDSHGTVERIRADMQALNCTFVTSPDSTSAAKTGLHSVEHHFLCPWSGCAIHDCHDHSMHVHCRCHWSCTPCPAPAAAGSACAAAVAETAAVGKHTRSPVPGAVAGAQSCRNAPGKE